MRNGWREARGVAGIVLLIGATLGAGPRASSRPADPAPVRLTLDVSWGDPALPALPDAKGEGAAVELEAPEGRVLEAILPAEAPAGAAPPRVRPDGTCRLGSGPTGRVRLRVETTGGASLVTRAGGQATRFAVAALLDAPQRTLPAAGVPIQVERVAWDALDVRLGPDGEADGIFAPGAAIPAALGFRVILPEPAEVSVRASAELRPVRGGEPLWTLAPHREVIATNALAPAGLRFDVPAPKAEGTYALDVTMTWEPADVAEGSRLARLFKRRRNPFPLTVTRRVTFVVMDPRGAAPTAPSGIESVADALDLSRPRGHRATASGRAPARGLGPWPVPEAALVEAPRRDRLRGWAPWGGTDVAHLPPADASGVAWSALTLRVAHPGRPHRLTVKVAEGRPADLGVALVATGDGGPRLLLDAAASGPEATEAKPASFAWPTWPDAEEAVLVLVNRSGDSGLRLGSVELRELAADPAPAAMADAPPDGSRPLALHLADPGALDRFGRDDPFALAGNLAAYALHCGASAVVLGDGPPERLARRALDGTGAEDGSGPDRLDVILRVLARRKLSAWREVRFDGPLGDLPPPESAEALGRGLVRVDRAGQADGPAYQPLRAEVRAAMVAHAAEAIAPRASHPNLAGLVVRLGPGSTLPGGPDVGLDDATFPRFARSAFPPEALAQVPGMDAKDPARFAARGRFVAGPGRSDWLEWRAEQIGALYGEMTRAVRKAAAGAALLVATPGLDDGPSGGEARRADRSGLSPTAAWEAVGLDLARWPTGPDAPIVARGMGLSGDDLGRDLATHPDLDAEVAARPGRGAWIGSTGSAPSAPGGPPRMTARPIADGPAGEELFGHALAVLDARALIVSGAAAAGQEERLSRFARVFRALPSPAETGPPRPRHDSGVAVRSWASGGKTYVAMANDTPYAILMESILRAPADAAVDDLGRRQRLAPAATPGGGRSLVLEMPPFGVAAVRVGAASATVEPVGPYLPSARDLDAQYARLSARLGRLDAGGTPAGPLNPGFEDPARPRTALVAEVRPPRAGPPPGWSAEGNAAGVVALDPASPHAGRSSLRLDVKAAPGAAACAPFLPPGRTALGVRAWLRADRAETPVRVWVEGESAGSPFVRHGDGMVGPAWGEFRLDVPDLPPGGLDRVRLRFERTTPGPLWLDDVAVTGDGPSESARRAQLTLTAALHAFREKRYADFARLAGSHWARPLGAEPEPEAADAPASVLRTGGAATDLPSGRRLR